jgi:nucleolar pre-ribosomal-associated protein 2
MLQSAIDYKLKLDLSILRSITSKFALPEGREDWKLLATIIKLDANVFLIANDEKDLLKELLERITKVSATQSWGGISEDVVSGVLVPLMQEFAQARDLSGFIRHWFSQFVEFEALQKNAQPPVNHFSAWEDVTLQEELSKLLETSLTVQQITQILDWLASQVTDSPAAVCIILEAIAGAISREDVVDSVGLRLYHIMFDNEASESLHDRYKWRSLRILSQALGWSTAHNIDELTGLWEEDANPFGSFLVLSEHTGLLAGQLDEMAELNILETFRFACAAWTAARKGSRMQEAAKPIVLNFLISLAQSVELFLGEIEADMKTDQGLSNPMKDALYRGRGCMVLSFARCIFVEYPIALE